MVGVVVNAGVAEREISAEEVKQAISFIPWSRENRRISVSSDKESDARKLFLNFFNDVLKLCQFRNIICLTTTGWKINTNVSSGWISWYPEDENK